MTHLTDSQALVLSRAAQRESGFLLPLPEECRARGGAADKVVAGLVKRGWATTVKGRELVTIPGGAQPWKTDENGEPLYAVITRAGEAAIGIVTDDGEARVEADGPAEAQAASDDAQGQEAAAGSRRTSRAAGVARRRLTAARTALDAVCTHWSATGRLDEALIGSCHATIEELQRAEARLEAEAPPAHPVAEPRQGTKQAQLTAMLRRPEGATIAQIADATGWQPHTVRGAFAGALKNKLGLSVTSEKPEGGERVYRIAEG